VRGARAETKPGEHVRLVFDFCLNRGTDAVYVLNFDGRLLDRIDLAAANALALCDTEGHRHAGLFVAARVSGPAGLLRKLDERGPP